jgi:DNA invertase Pin-like site-specific DNA recombinase
VSVTQQFNTTTSMGRLTLNMLLSFAQFEREIAGERIRDKIAASKKKGMWMGGNVPLGYDVKDRSRKARRRATTSRASACLAAQRLSACVPLALAAAVERNRPRCSTTPAARQSPCRLRL